MDLRLTAESWSLILLVQERKDPKAAAVLAAVVVGDTAEDETTEGNLLEFLVCYNGTGSP